MRGERTRPEDCSNALASLSAHEAAAASPLLPRPSSLSSDHLFTSNPGCALRLTRQGRRHELVALRLHAAFGHGGVDLLRMQCATKGIGQRGENAIVRRRSSKRRPQPPTSRYTSRQTTRGRERRTISGQKTELRTLRALCHTSSSQPRVWCSETTAALEAL